MVIDTRESDVVKIAGNGDLILTKDSVAFDLKTDKSSKTAFHIKDHVIYCVGSSASFGRKIRMSLKVLKYIFSK
ncbi:hypothetical protein [Bacillus pumilus]|jgi:hypothetical protein|uniref:hypothetical protein n=1 Tax=Bacillus pumilus TaxID=1408 RepID=UPI00081F9A22|nr:hypothetical protein [Bacillus pumilus]AOC55322.1 hypothetical protein BEN31_00225 [Bacillus pumilus]MBR0588509.1 hypothetical protein [Bacillus pumilus DW2J2]MBR0618451.1 hypothetical protein [Bacillus pumilus]MBR0624746.1 hypothetical protein [Bacillus pumilus]MCY7724105.1 hypothetical protein [Bacillus pumilus]